LKYWVLRVERPSPAVPQMRFLISLGLFAGCGPALSFALANVGLVRLVNNQGAEKLPGCPECWSARITK
jgi:hypothetical protein